MCLQLRLFISVPVNWFTGKKLLLTVTGNKSFTGNKLHGAHRPSVGVGVDIGSVALFPNGNSEVARNDLTTCDTVRSILLTVKLLVRICIVQ